MTLTHAYRVAILPSAMLCLLIIGCSKSRQSPFSSTRTPAVPEVPLQTVQWIEIEGPPASLSEALEEHQNAIVLFHIKTCMACARIKTWWQGRKAPEGWAFLSWEFSSEDDVPRYTQSVIRAYGISHPQADGHWEVETYPVISVIERPRDNPHPRYLDLVSVAFDKHAPCTEGLLSWLTTHPRGLKPE